MQKYFFLSLVVLFFLATSLVAQNIFNDGFEAGNTDQSTTISGWTQATGAGTYYWTANSSLTNYNRTPRTGTWNAFLHYSGNSWLFKQVTLTAGTTYTFKMYARQDGATASNASMEVKYGTANTAAAMTNNVITSTGIINGDYQLISGLFTVATTGTYYIGIHGIINATPWYISLDDISLDVAANMTYTSCTTTQNNTANVSPSQTNQEILGIQVVTSGPLNPISATSFTLNTNGTTSASDLTSAKLYYSGTNNTFSTASQFGTAVTNPNGTFTFTGNQALSEGTNYFWLAYDISSSAASNDYIDAECTSITVAGTLRTPTLTAPTGRRQIKLQVSIGNGTSTQSYPFNTVWGYSRFASIYKASDLGNTAKTITQLAWNVATAPTVNAPVKIYLKAVTDTVLTVQNWATLTTGATLVYNGTVSFTPTGLFSLNLSSYFNTSSTDNLMILTEANYGGSGIAGPTFYYTTSTNRSAYITQDTTPPTGNLTLSSNRPNITISYANPTNMIYTSSTTTQDITSAVMAGSVNQQIIGINIVTDGSLNPIPVTAFNLNTTGTTNNANISNAKLWFTGTSSTFATATQFGTTVNSPSGNFAFSGSSALNPGNNYFWLTYDIAGSVTEYNVVDAQCTQLTVNGVNYVPAVTNPAGNRSLRNPMNGIYTINQTGTGSRNYLSFDAAIADLNLLGTNAAVTFNIPAGQIFPITTPASPNNYAVKLSTTGTAAKPIIFQKSGTGANPILNVTGTSVSTDAGICLYGTDYITIDGLDIIDLGTSSTNYLDYGIYLTGPTDNNCNNVLIKNCNIDLTKANTSSKGVYSYSSGPTVTDNANSNNKFYNNTLQDAYNGYYFTSSSTTIYDSNNEVGIVTNGTSTITNIAYAAITYSYQANIKLFNNTISNVGNTTTNVYGIYSGLGSANTADIYNNSISGLTGTYSSSIYGLYLTAGTTHNIYGNNINTISNTLGSAYGIYIASTSSVNNIYKNSIHNVLYSGAGSYSAYGIYTSTGTTHNIYNNFIYDIKAPVSTATTAVAGLYLSAGTNVNTYYNTIMLDYATTGSGANKSAAIYASTSPTTIDLRNNIFINNVNLSGNTSSSTKAIALWRSGTATTNISTTTNNNLYYAGALNGVKNLIHYDGTNMDSTLAQYKTRMGTKDQNSYSEEVPFISVIAPYNLHVNSSIPTQVEKGALPVSTPFAITDDFDSQVRNTTTPDIGADEGAFSPNDITPPSITLTALGNTSQTANRILSGVTITDQSNIDSFRNKPRLYFKKKSNANVFLGNTSADNGWKYVVTSSNTSPYNFTINYTLLTSLPIVGDTIQYFVIAKDNAPVPNIGAFPSTGFAATYTPATYLINITSAPTTPLSYNIVQSIAGTKIVGGTTPDYINLKTAFNDINAKALSGNLTLSIAGDITETTQASLNQVLSDGGTFTITIKPAATLNPTITGSFAGALINLNNADHVTIDGSNTTGGTTKNLTIWNKTTAGHGVGITNGSEYSTIKNTKIKGNSNSATSYGVYVAGENNDNVTLDNNEIRKFNQGIYAPGTSTTILNDYLTISNNSIGDDIDSLSVGNKGMYITYANNLNITNNRLNKIIVGNNPKGIEIANSNTAIVSKNLIHNVTYKSTSGYGGKAIDFNNSNTVTIDNNVIYDISGDGYNSFSTDNIVGIRLLGTGTNYNIYFNSINLYGNISRTSATTDKSAGIYIASTISGINLKDNSIANSLVNTSGVARSYSVYSDAPVSAFTSNNYNLYYSSGAEAWLAHIGSTDIYSSLDSLKTLTAMNQNSLYANPAYVSDTNLIPNNVSPLYHTGTPLSGFATDYTGYTRHVSTPSIGAYDQKDTGPIPVPMISFTPISSPWMTTSATLSNVTINNGNTAPNVTTNKPRIYFKKSTETNAFGANTSAFNGWKWTETTNTVNPFSFSFDFTKLTSAVAPGDTLQYFVVAQDQLTPQPYVDAYPRTGFAATSVGSITTAPTTPYRFSLAMISYTALGDTWLTSNMILNNVTITNGNTAPNVTTAKPRIYYKKRTEANAFGANTSAFNGWKWTETTNTSNPFSFTIDYSKLTSAVVPGDSIQYFVVAQDQLTTLPFVDAYPRTGFAATSVANITSAPTTPYKYGIKMTIQSFPYITDFETWPPANWDISSGTKPWAQYVPTTGNKSAYANYWGWTAGFYANLTSTYINLSSLTNPVLEFKWSHLYSATYPTDSLKVQVSLNGTNWTNVWAISDTTFNSHDGAGNTAPGTYKLTSINLSAYAGTAIQIRFYARSGYGPNLYLDDITVKNGASSLTAPVVQVVNNTSGNIVLSWPAVPGAGSYKIYRSSDPNAVFTSWTYIATISGLTYSYVPTTGKMFFKVTASSDLPARSAVPVNTSKQTGFDVAK